MAIDFLPEAYWRGLIKRFYRHELEASIWVLPFTFLVFDNNSGRVRCTTIYVDPLEVCKNTVGNEEVKLGECRFGAVIDLYQKFAMFIGHDKKSMKRYKILQQSNTQIMLKSPRLEGRKVLASNCISDRLSHTLDVSI